MKCRLGTGAPARAASPPTRGAWIEMHDRRLEKKTRQSPPTRGAWIEMAPPKPWRIGRAVAPRTGGVD